eukprot:gb/GECG01004967.1/.p1 GENE.gb/GECG01004967.1/~~gb/GECG01004967.1/.p1  ORF type:complete len:132 (+),score=11.25 gb/GECG01004967.1/:1-396(+)
MQGAPLIINGEIVRRPPPAQRPARYRDEAHEDFINRMAEREEWKRTVLGWLKALFAPMFLLKVTLWFVVCYFLGDFWLIWFMVTLMYLMCTQLGTRKKGEKSAYSVFNDNFETLPGQLTAERFDRELRHNY